MGLELTKFQANGRCATGRFFHELGNIHDLEASQENRLALTTHLFLTHWVHLSVLMFWVAGNLFHIAWNGNYELYIRNPIANMPIAHALWDPHLGSYLSVVYSAYGGDASSESSSSASVVIAFSGIYNWLYVSGFNSAYQIYNFSMLCELLAVFCLVLGNLHFVSKEDMFKATNHYNQPIFRRLLLACIDATGLRLNFHIGAMIGSFSILWSGHLLRDVGLQARTLTFLGGLNPDTSSINLTDLAHHHVAVGVLFVWSGHVYSSYFKGFAHRLRDILFVNGNSGLTILSHGKSLHLQLSLACASLSVLTSLVAQHIYALSPYPYWTYDTLTLVANYVHHSWIASGLMMGSFAHASLFLIRDYTKSGLQPTANGHMAGFDSVYRIIELKAAIISHISWVSLWIGFHLLALYIHNDTVTAFGEPDKQLMIEPVFAQVLHGSLGKGLYGGVDNVNETFGSLLLPLGPGDLLAHHAISLALHVTTLIALKGSLDSRGSKLMPDKLHVGFGYACDGPGRGGTCDISAWDALYLAAFWALNGCAWIIFYFHWKHLSLNTISQFYESSTFLNGWFTDYLWFNSAALIRGYDSLGSNTALSVWAWAFLAAHLSWATGFMFLISWRGYWQELIETLLYMHLKCPKLYDLWSGSLFTPVALSIVQARFIGLVHFAVGFILSYSSFLFGIIR
jgi:photosystem I P700 chlorophyll a apoprotein A2